MQRRILLACVGVLIVAACDGGGMTIPPIEAPALAGGGGGSFTYDPTEREAPYLAIPVGECGQTGGWVPGGNLAQLCNRGGYFDFIDTRGRTFRGESCDSSRNDWCNGIAGPGGNSGGASGTRPGIPPILDKPSGWSPGKASGPVAPVDPSTIRLEITVTTPRAFRAAGAYAPATVRISSVRLTCGPDSTLCLSGQAALDGEDLASLALTNSSSSYKACTSTRERGCQYHVVTVDGTMTAEPWLTPTVCRDAACTPYPVAYGPNGGTLEAVFFSPTPSGTPMTVTVRLAPVTVTYRTANGSIRDTTLTDGQIVVRADDGRTFSGGSNRTLAVHVVGTSGG